MCLQLTPQYASFAAWHSHVHGQAGNIAWYWGRGGINTTFAAKENAPGDFADQALTQPAAIDGYLLHCIGLCLLASPYCETELNQEKRKSEAK